VVIGAGIAGLTTACTLADRFDRVVVLDRDRLPDEAIPRSGVPQGEHGHVLLMAGQRALDQLFPGG
jgi:glycine/D-amino acid oxidase-like deaminating enzyme